MRTQATPVGPEGAPAGAATSPRETQVLALIALRYTNGDIAAELGISKRTVESHVAALLRKLGATDRAQLRTLGQCLAPEYLARQGNVAADRHRAGVARHLPDQMSASRAIAHAARQIAQSARLIEQSRELLARTQRLLVPPHPVRLQGPRTPQLPVSR